MDKIKKLAIAFINTHFSEIYLEELELEHYTKSKIIKEINKDYSFACWVVTEAMSWGTQKDYLAGYRVAHDGDFLVIEVDDTYFKFNRETHCYDEVEAKTKLVTYFE